RKEISITPIVDVPQALREQLGPEATKEFIALLNTVREDDYQRMKQAVRDIVRAEIAESSEKINERIDEKYTTLSERINSVETSLNERLNSVESSLIERINSMSQRIDDKQSSVLRWVIGLIVPLYIVIILGFISLVVTLAP
ncbi:MAG TPA: hypothetical protein VKA68_10375, partial [bacterium]|nr:hypothetical protein [bacterium]